MATDRVILDARGTGLCLVVLIFVALVLTAPPDGGLEAVGNFSKSCGKSDKEPDDVSACIVALVLAVPPDCGVEAVGNFSKSCGKSDKELDVSACIEAAEEGLDNEATDVGLLEALTSTATGLEAVGSVEGAREVAREGGREGAREVAREGGREGGREVAREGGRDRWLIVEDETILVLSVECTVVVGVVDRLVVSLLPITSSSIVGASKAGSSGVFDNSGESGVGLCHGVGGRGVNGDMGVVNVRCCIL